MGEREITSGKQKFNKTARQADRKANSFGHKPIHFILRDFRCRSPDLLTLGVRERGRGETKRERGRETETETETDEFRDREKEKEKLRDREKETERESSRE